MPSNKMYDRLCSPNRFSGNANRTFEDTQATAGDFYHIPEARFSEAVCENSFEWGLKAIWHFGIQKWLQPRKWGISLKIRIFIKIKKCYFSGSSIICSWKFIHCWWLYWPKFSAGVPLKNKSRDSRGKYWKNCGFVINCWYFFSQDTLGGSQLFFYCVCTNFFDTIF